MSHMTINGETINISNGQILVNDSIDAGNSVVCDNVGGSMDADNSITCGDVRGNVNVGNKVIKTK